jgi:hypothetical protein
LSWFVSEVRNGAGNKNGCQPGGSFPFSCGMPALRGTDCYAGAMVGFTAKPQMVSWGCKHTCACSGRDQYGRAGVTSFCGCGCDWIPILLPPW